MVEIVDQDYAIKKINAFTPEQLVELDITEYLNNFLVEVRNYAKKKQQRLLENQKNKIIQKLTEKLVSLK